MKKYKNGLIKIDRETILKLSSKRVSNLLVILYKTANSHTRISI